MELWNQVLSLNIFILHVTVISYPEWNFWMKGGVHWLWCYLNLKNTTQRLEVLFSVKIDWNYHKNISISIPLIIMEKVCFKTFIYMYLKQIVGRIERVYIQVVVWWDVSSTIDTSDTGGPWLTSCSRSTLSHGQGCLLN